MEFFQSDVTFLADHIQNITYTMSIFGNEQEIEAL